MDNKFKKFVFVLYVLIGAFSANVMAETIDDDLTVKGKIKSSDAISAKSVSVDGNLTVGGGINADGDVVVKTLLSTSKLRVYDDVTVFDSDENTMVSLNDKGSSIASPLALYGFSINYMNPRLTMVYDSTGWNVGAYVYTPNPMVQRGVYPINLNIESSQTKMIGDVIVDSLLTTSELQVGSESQKCYINKDGSVQASGSLSVSPSQGPAAKWSVQMEDGVWTVSSKFYTAVQPMSFDASDYTFKNGNMIVEGTITCKDSLKVAEVKTDNLRAKNVTVDMGDAADYVFDENYDLKSLGEVEAYVKANKHLPGIPSASQMKEEGMNVSEMSNLLLEKIEELTLHVIRLEKENQELKSEMKAMKSGK